MGFSLAGDHRESGKFPCGVTDEKGNSFRVGSGAAQASSGVGQDPPLQKRWVVRVEGGIRVGVVSESVFPDQLVTQGKKKSRRVYSWSPARHDDRA